MEELSKRMSGPSSCQQYFWRVYFVLPQLFDRAIAFRADCSHYFAARANCKQVIRYFVDVVWRGVAWCEIRRSRPGISTFGNNPSSQDCNRDILILRLKFADCTPSVRTQDTRTDNLPALLELETLDMRAKSIELNTRHMFRDRVQRNLSPRKPFRNVGKIFPIRVGCRFVSIPLYVPGEYRISSHASIFQAMGHHVDAYHDYVSAIRLNRKKCSYFSCR